MDFTKQQVFEVCKIIAPTQKFDVKLIQAVCLQEGGRNKDGSFAPDRARLENGFYSRYVEDNSYSTTTEVLLSASYGVMQIMGLELLRMGYFDFYFNQAPQGLKNILSHSKSQFAIPSGIDAFCENLNWQIEWGCKLMNEKRNTANKMSEFKGETDKTKMMLLLWNGGGNKEYANEVLAKQKSIG